MIGKKVIVRANMAGVFFGTLKEENGRDVVLTDARKLYYWSGGAAVEGISKHGVSNPDSCKFTVKVDEIGIKDICQIIPCTDEAIESLENVAEWKL